MGERISAWRRRKIVSEAARVAHQKAEDLLLTHGVIFRDQRRAAVISGWYGNGPPGSDDVHNGRAGIADRNRGAAKQAGHTPSADRHGRCEHDEKRQSPLDTKQHDALCSNRLAAPSEGLGD